MSGGGRDRASLARRARDARVESGDMRHQAKVSAPSLAIFTSILSSCDALCVERRSLDGTRLRLSRVYCNVHVYAHICAYDAIRLYRYTRAHALL